MTTDELIAMLSALRRYGVETYEVGLSGPKVKFFPPKETAQAELRSDEPTEVNQPKPGLGLKDLFWSSPEYQEESVGEESKP